MFGQNLCRYKYFSSDKINVTSKNICRILLDLKETYSFDIIKCFNIFSRKLKHVC